MPNKFEGMNQFLKDKLRAPTMTAHDAPDGGDTQLTDAAAVLADDAGDFAYTPPFPVPVMQPITRGEGMRGSASETWLVNPLATLPGLGVLVGGGNAEKGSQFPVNSIRVDNLTSQWLYWPENGVFVPPFWYGRVFRFTGAQVQRVRFETPTGITALTVAATQIARVIFSEDYWDEESGASAVGNLGAGTVGGQPFTFLADNADAQAVQTTAVDLLTLSRNEVFNGTTWDRARSGADNANNIAGVAAGIPRVAAEAFVLGANGLTWNRVLGGPVSDGIDGQNSYTASILGFNGATFDRLRLPNVFKQINNVALLAGSTATVWTPAAGKKPRLMGWVVDGVSGLVDAAITFFETSTTGTFMGDVGYIAGLGTPAYFSYGNTGPIVSTSSAVIVAFSSTAVTFRGTLWGTEE